MRCAAHLLLVCELLSLRAGPPSVKLRQQFNREVEENRHRGYDSVSPVPRSPPQRRLRVHEPDLDGELLEEEAVQPRVSLEGLALDGGCIQLGVRKNSQRVIVRVRWGQALG